jgi:hypothetical protein
MEHRMGHNQKGLRVPPFVSPTVVKRKREIELGKARTTGNAMLYVFILIRLDND